MASHSVDSESVSGNLIRFAAPEIRAKDAQFWALLETWRAAEKASEDHPGEVDNDPEAAQLFERANDALEAVLETQVSSATAINVKMGIAGSALSSDLNYVLSSGKSLFQVIRQDLAGVSRAEMWPAFASGSNGAVAALDT